MKAIKKTVSALLALAIAALLAGCMRGEEESVSWHLRGESPKLPERLETADGVPVLNVYDVFAGRIEQMGIEDYVAGVVAGEMKNDWPEEALKAQAILARTFVLKFCQDKRSKYEGADISTDVAEAQAYDASSVNERVERAVEATRGQVMSVDGEYPYAWFHAHAGGMTELPTVALDFKGEDPGYLRPTASDESDKAPEDVKHWEATFTKDQVARACAGAGLKVDAIQSVELGERGESGRAKTLVINGRSVSAPTFRIQIGANRLKSTLIDDVKIEGDAVRFSGRGFGHGVGMSQWGAYGMAEDGADARQIVEHYFPGVEIVGMWE